MAFTLQKGDHLYMEECEALGSMLRVPLKYFTATQCQLKWTPVKHGLVVWKETFRSFDKPALISYFKALQFD